MLRTILRNIASSWMGYAVNAAVIFFLTPFVLHTLGDTRYGVWILVNGLTGYFGLLDLGLRSGTTQYLTRYLAKGDYPAINRTASTSVAALAACGLTVALISAVVSWLSPLIFTIPETAVTEVRWCIAIIGIAVGAQFGFAPFSAVFVAKQRYDLINAVEISLRLSTAAGVYVVLQAGYGLLGLCLVESTGRLLACLVRQRIAHRILPALQISVRLAAWRDFWPIISYGAMSSLVQGGTVLKNYSSSLVIALLMPVAALAPFNLAARLVMQVDRLFAPVGMVFFPVATQFDAQQDLARQRRMYFAVSRIMLCGAATAALIGSIWAADFYRLWVGSKFVDGDEYTSVVVLFWILIAGGIVTIGQKIGVQILLGCRAMRLLALLTLGEAVAGVVLMVPLIHSFGLCGVAFATLVPVIIVRGLLFPITVCHLIQSRTVDYFRAAYLRPCLLALALAGPLLLIRHTVPVDGSWARLTLCGFLATLTAAPLLLLLGVDGEERRRLITNPIQRIWLRLSRRQAVDARL